MKKDILLNIWRSFSTKKSIYIKASLFFACSLLVLALNTASKSSFSLCLYVCIGLPGPAHLATVKYSLFAVNEQAIRQNISLWQGVLVLEGQYNTIGTTCGNETIFGPCHDSLNSLNSVKVI